MYSVLKKKKKKTEMLGSYKRYGPGAWCALVGGATFSIPTPSALALPNADGELELEEELE